MLVAFASTQINLTKAIGGKQEHTHKIDLVKYFPECRLPDTYMRNFRKTASPTNVHLDPFGAFHPWDYCSGGGMFTTSDSYSARPKELAE